MCGRERDVAGPWEDMGVEEIQGKRQGYRGETGSRAGGGERERQEQGVERVGGRDGCRSRRWRGTGRGEKMHTSVYLSETENVCMCSGSILKRLSKHSRISGKGEPQPGDYFNWGPSLNDLT